MRSALYKSIFLALALLLVAPPTTIAQVPDDFLEDEDDMSIPPGPPPPMEGDPMGAPPSADFSNPSNSDSGFTPPSAGGTGSSFEAAKKRSRKIPFSQAQPEDITNENFPEIIDSFDYPNAEISDVVKAISELTGKNFIIEPSVRGKITIIAPTPITVAEAYRAFLSALAINGFTVVPSGKFLKIRQVRAAARDSIEIYSGAYTPNTDQIVTRIIHLKHISADDVKKSLLNITSKDGDLQVYSATNSLILTDWGANVERVMKILAQLDVKGFEEQLEVIPIRHAKSKDIADLIDQIINKGEGKRQGRGFQAGIPRFTRSGDQGSGNNAFSMVLPDDRTNAIIVVGNKAGLVKIKELVKKLDYEIRPEDAGGVYVYHVKYGEAAGIAEAIKGVTADTNKKANSSNDTGSPFPPPPSSMPQPSAGSAGLFGGEVKMVANTTTNSLIVTASRQDYEVVLNLLSKIDIPKDQVYVEALIMEMNSESTNSWGVNYYQFNPETKGVGRLGFSSGDLGSLLNVTGDSGAILGWGSGKVFEIAGPNGNVSITSFATFVKFLKGLNNVNILSTPQILAADNEVAEIEVGDTIPVGLTNTLAGTGASQSAPQRENATIKLNIQPFISPDSETVRLKIDQQIKQLSNKQVAAKALADIAVVTTERKVKTSITVENGSTAVIGGLIREEEQIQENKVPLLGDIPLIGWLFKGSNTRRGKVNLLVFITPKIIRNKADARNMLGKKLNERLEFIKSSYGGRDPYGKKADELYKKSSNE